MEKIKFVSIKKQIEEEQLGSTSIYDDETPDVELLEELLDSGKISQEFYDYQTRKLYYNGVEF